MKKNIRITLLLLLYSIVTNAQLSNKSIDSLTQRLSTEKEDTVQVMLMWSLARAYAASKPDTALLIAQHGLDLSQKIHFKKGELNCQRTVGYIFINTGNYPKALESYLGVLKISEELHDDASIGTALGNLSDVYFYNGDISRSIDYSQKCISIYRKIKDSIRLATEFIDLGDTYEKNEQIDSALHYTKLGYSIIMPSKNTALMGSCFNNLGNIFLKLRKADSAMMYYKSGLPYIIHNNDDYAICESYLGIAKIFLQKNNKDSCLHYAKLSFDIAKNAGFTDNLLLASNFLAEYYKSVRNIDSAYAYQAATIAAKDSLFSQQKANQFQSITYDEDTRQQQIKDAKEQERAQAKQNALIGGLGALLIVIFLLYINIRQRRKSYALLQHQKLETDNQKQKAESTLSELKSTQQQLIQSEKMASLGELTAGIAHEIQNPLNFVNNFSEVNKEMLEELKAERLKPNAERDDDLQNDLIDDVIANEEKINHHGKRADAIVKGMLQHSRQSSGKKEPTDINALCDEYLRLSFHGLRVKDKSFNTDFKTEFDETIGKINIVPQDIGRVLLNLFNNAFYAVNEKRKNLSSLEDLTGLVTVQTKKLHNKIEIRISDNGNGIPQNIIDKIFQPFFTTKPTGEGTGLGLSLSYDIITKEHNGTIKVNSKEGERTEFIVQLPLIKED